jgi:hypothetical protein
LRRRADDGICLVTFNYDTIIEHALRSVGITINGLPSYISDSRYKLIKLHGSVDWAHPIRFVRDNRPHTEQVDEFRQWIIENIASLKVDFEAFEVTKAHPMSFAEESYPAPHRGAFIQMGTRKVGHFPAIAIPVRQKDRFECPADHVKALESCLPQVDRVLIVGWRATEVPFLNLLTAATRARRGIPQVLVVGEHRNSVEKTIANLQQAGLDGHFTSYIAGFSAFVTSQELMKFLEP